VKGIGIWILIGMGTLAIVGALLPMLDGEPELAADFSLVSLDGETVSLSGYRGRVVLLDFWASWCAPCTKTFPTLHELHERFADRGVDFLVVSLDGSEKKSREHLEENGFPTDNVLWGSLDEARAVKRLYGVIGIPRTFLIDRDGFIRFDGHPRSLTAETIESWL
jgi:cytochrome c biogenesis protein CcmG/thiol:disulfide interchange protein DsbE